MKVCALFLISALLLSGCGRLDNDKAVYESCIKKVKNVLGNHVEFAKEIKFEFSSQDRRESIFTVPYGKRKSSIKCSYFEDSSLFHYYVEDVKIEIDGKLQTKDD